MIHNFFFYSILSFWLAFSATVCSEVVASVKKVKPLNDHGVLSHFPVPILLLRLSVTGGSRGLMDSELDL